jgi:hypothetical protein
LFFHANDKKYKYESKHSKEEMVEDIEKYTCHYFEKLEKDFHSSKILTENGTRDVANLIFRSYGFMRPTLIGKIDENNMKSPLSIDEQR